MVEAQRFFKDVHKQLEAVYLIVLYHGDTTWRAPTNFVDLYKLPQAAHAGVLSFRHSLSDLKKTADENFPSDRQLRTLLLVLKYCRMVREHRLSPELATLITPLLAKVLALNTEVYQSAALVCLGEMAGGEEVVGAVIEELAPKRKEAIMSNWAREHEQKGRQEGKAETLVDLIKTRFGALSSALHARILSADTATLTTWLHRFAKGEDLESIFAGGRPSAKVIPLKSKTSVRRSGRSPDDSA